MRERKKKSGGQPGTRGTSTYSRLEQLIQFPQLLLNFLNSQGLLVVEQLLTQSPNLTFLL